MHKLETPRLVLTYVPDVETVDRTGNGRCGVYYAHHGDADVGAISVTALARAHGEIGYEIEEAFRGQGFATEALAAVITALPRYHGFTIVSAQALADNIASRRVLEKSGFTRVGAKLCWMESARRALSIERFRRVTA